MLSALATIPECSTQELDVKACASLYVSWSGNSFGTGGRSNTSNSDTCKEITPAQGEQIQTYSSSTLRLNLSKVHLYGEILTVAIHEV